jgi:carboxylesterase type B
VPASSLTSLPDFGESGPVIDRQLLTEPAQTAFEHGRTLNVPLIIGTNNNEGSLLPPDARPADMVQQLSESDYETLMAFYRPHAAGDADHGSLATDKVTQVLHGCWVEFAKTGIPTCADVPAWPVYSVESDVLMRFAAQAVPELVPDGPILDFLQSRLLAPAQP